MRAYILHKFYTTSTEPLKFLEPLSGEVFVLILTIAQLDITLEFFSFYSVYSSASNLVFVFVCVIVVEVNVCVCEDRG